MISPKLLVVYVRAAAREACEGSALSPRSRWAVDEAMEELGTYRDVVKGRAPEGSLGYSLSVARSHTAKDRTRIADVFIASSLPDPAASPDGEEAAIADSLNRAISDLEELTHGDAAAAARILETVAGSPAASS